MYKKLSVLLVCLLVLSQFAYAEQKEIISGIVEDFTLRNGVKFLMTREEVQDKEEIPAEFQKYSVYENNLQIKGGLAGINDAVGYYVFDDESLLQSFEYSFGGGMNNRKNRAQVQVEYDSVESALNEKYGGALSNNSSIRSSYLIDDIANLDDFGDNFDIISYSERLIKNNSGGYVKIEHWSTYQTIDSDLEIVNHHVQYTYFADEFVNAIISNVELKEAQKDSDL